MKNRKFELFEILTLSEKLKMFRESYIESLEEPIAYKVISNRPEWYYYDKGQYDFESEMNGSFYEFSLIPLRDYDSKFINNFIKYGPDNPNFVKSIKYEGKEIYLFTSSSINKRGRRFSVEPVIKISEDLYNLSKIQYRDFDSINTDDISRYSEFFRVSQVPYSTTYESRIEDLYRTRNISKEEYEFILKKYEQEEKLVKTLRKGI